MELFCILNLLQVQLCIALFGGGSEAPILEVFFCLLLECNRQLRESLGKSAKHAIRPHARPTGEWKLSLFSFFFHLFPFIAVPSTKLLSINTWFSA